MLQNWKLFKWQLMPWWRIPCPISPNKLQVKHRHRAEDIAQWGKSSLLSEYENPNSNPRLGHEDWVWLHMLVTQALWVAETGGPLGLVATSLNTGRVRGPVPRD